MADGAVDFDEAGRRLMGEVDAHHDRSYNDLDAIWRDPTTGGIIIVGNETAARASPSAFAKLGITHVVNCTDDMPNFHEGADEPERPRYYRFNVVAHARYSTQVASLLQFLVPLFGFVDSALAAGGNVLVHCLAGAHRAGTTGCLLLMYKEKLRAADAVATARQRRPVIHPIGNLPALLGRFDQLRRTDRWTTWAEAARAKQEALKRQIAAARAAPPREPERHEPADDETTAMQRAWAEAEVARQAQEARLGPGAADAAALRHAWAEAEAERQAQEARLARAPRRHAWELASEPPAEPAEPPVALFVEALRAIGTRADELYAEAASLPLARVPAIGARVAVDARPTDEEQAWLERQLADAEVLAQLDSEHEEEQAAARMAREERADDGDDGSDDDAHVRRATERRAAEHARLVEAARASEAHLAAAERAQAERDAADGSSALLASSIATAMGVPVSVAAEALRASGGDLSRVMHSLDQSKARAASRDGGVLRAHADAMHAALTASPTRERVSASRAHRDGEGAVDEAARAAAAAAAAMGDERGAALAEKARELAGLRKYAAELSEMLAGLRTMKE
jgi:hypothetical protein